MILIIGGYAQGKTKYARACFPDRPIMEGFHLMIEECMNAGNDPVEYVDKLILAESDLVITMDEMGSGVVPIELHSRKLRDEVGRTGCYLASRAEEVYRVVAGIGMRIK